MARTDGLFYIRQSAYVSPVSDASIWLRGNDKYISFGSVAGASGYGFRDNGGVMQFKNSGGSWTNVGTGGGGGGGMAIGDTITSSTVGSSLFVGTGGVLQQDNANYFWNNTNKSLGLGTNTADFRLDIAGTDIASSGIEMTRFSDNAFSPTIQSRKARGTSSVPTAVLANDVLWRVQGQGYDGSAYDLAGNISIIANDVTSGVVTGAVAMATANDAGTMTNGIYMDKNQKVGFSVTPGATNGRFTLGGNVTSANRGNAGAWLTLNSGLTATDTASSGIVTFAHSVGLFSNTFSATNATSYTQASTLFISAPPIAGTNVTITNNWALYVNSGESFFAGGLQSGSAVRTATIRANTSLGTVFQTNGASDVLHIGNGGGVNATAYGGWNFDAATANTVAVFGASKTLSSSSVTTTELGYVSGVTSSIQTQLNGKASTGAVTASGITMSTARILGRTTAATGAIEEISIGSGLSLSAGVLSATGAGVTDGDKGDITVSSSGTVWTIDNTAVTYAKIQNVAANTFLANATGSSATVQEIATNRIPLFSSAITGTPSSTTFLRGDGTWATPSGGGSPGGSSGNVQFNDAGAFGGMSGTTWNDTNRTLGITGATLTTSNPIFDLSQTWNGAGVDFVGHRINITNTASATRSVIFRASVGGTPVFDVRTDNAIVLGNSFSGNQWGIVGGNGIRATQFSSGSPSASSFLCSDVRAGGSATAGQFNAYLGATTGLILLNTGSMGFSNTSNTDLRGTADTVFFRDGAGQMAQRNGTNSQSLRVYKTFTDASNFERLEINGTSTAGWLQIIANSAGTGSANLGIALTPRGTGAISAQVPDSTSTGGNARGSNAVDLQMSRVNANQVASGTRSGVLSGSRNQASEQEAVVAGGNENAATGMQSWVPGGNQATTRGLLGARAYSSGQRTAKGDAQVIGQPVRVTTTATSTADLTANGAAVSSTNVMVLPNNSSAGFVAKVAARNATSVGSGYWEVRGTIERGANAASTAIVGSVTVTSFGISASLGAPTVTVVANTTQGGAVVQVTPANTNTTYWVADLELIQVA